MTDLFFIISLFILLILSGSCSIPVYSEGVVDIESFGLKTNMAKFYRKAFDKYISKLTSHKQEVVQDTLAGCNVHWNGNRDEIFGIHYSVVSPRESDVVQNYNKVDFFLLESMVNLQGELT